MNKFIVYFVMALAMIFSPVAYADDSVTPGIGTLSETSGSTEGGNTVTATGVYFSESTTVTVNGNEAVVEYIDANTINITLPPGSAGDADIRVSNNGISFTTSMQGYEYVAPDPEPAPEPVPDPEPASISAPAPAPQPMSNPAPQIASVPEPPYVVETEAVEEVVAETITNISYLSDNAYLVYNDNVENLVVSTTYDIPQKFVLLKRVDGEWVYIDKSYEFDGFVVFLDTNLELGSTYKVIVEIDGKKTIAAWFDVLEKRYTVI